MPHPKPLNTINNLNKVKHQRMFLCAIEPLILTGKLRLTALKSVISSPKFTSFVAISDKITEAHYIFIKTSTKRQTCLKLPRIPPLS